MKTATATNNPKIYITITYIFFFSKDVNGSKKKEILFQLTFCQYMVFCCNVYIVYILAGWSIHESTGRHVDTSTRWQFQGLYSLNYPMNLQVDGSTGRCVDNFCLKRFLVSIHYTYRSTGRQVDAMTVLNIVESTQRAHRFNGLQFLPTLNPLNGFNFILSR